jgi:methionyl-tRNA formyltransferase
MTSVTRSEKSPRLRVVFMGTPDFAVQTLRALHQHHEVVAVYTQPDRPVGRGLELKPPPVKVEAQRLGISQIRQPLKLSQMGEFEVLQAARPDIIVVVAYGQILRKNVLELPRLGCVNIHSSLLPRWRGAAPIQRALLEGDTVTGVATMKLVEKLDAGDILLESRTEISPKDTAGTLHDRLALLGAELIIPTLEGLAHQTLRGTVQDEGKVTYAAKLTKEMEWLDPLSKTAQELDRQVRALNPWPGTSLLVEVAGKRERLKVRQVQPHASISGEVGALFERFGMLLVGTSMGSLQIERAQWDGKKEMDAASLLNGLRGRGVSLPLKVQPMKPEELA